MSDGDAHVALPAENYASLTGGVVLPALVGTIYGVAYYFEYASIEVALILVLGGIASIICAQAMMGVFYAPPGRSWTKAIAALSTFVPYFYSLFLMVFFGLWHGWIAVTKYHGLGAIVAAIFWLLVGWRMLFVLGKITRKERT